MAIQVKHYMVDDLAASKDPRSEVIADQTVRFSVMDEEYEIDLSTEHAGSFFDMVGPYKRAGRRVRRSRRPRTAAKRAQTAMIRNWAREKGFEVSGYGRLPADLVARYEAEHQAPVT